MTKAIAYGYGKEIYLTTEQADKLLKSSQSVEQMKAQLRKVLDNV